MTFTASPRKTISSRAGGRVTLDGIDTVMLGSNDYLGLSLDERVLSATQEALTRYGTGTGIYPVFATTPLHDELSQALASFVGVEAVALFSSGGTANVGVLTTLVEAGDVIVSDRLNHASIIDGCRLSRAEVLSYENRSIEDLETVLQKTSGARRRLVVTDGIFSMEGRAAPLRRIYMLAQEYDAVLVVDEAHATGVVGAGGTGTSPLCGLPNNSPGLILTGSLSKAIGGASGGFVAGSQEVIDRLQRHSRSWIFTMGMTTANAATALAALNVCRSDTTVLERLIGNLQQVRSAFRFYGLPFLDSDSAITALIIGEEDHARSVSQTLRSKGVYAPAMAFPIVARGQARLRIQVSASHTVADLDQAAATLAEVVLDEVPHGQAHR